MKNNTAPRAEELAPLRHHFPVLENSTYLNTGTAGPIPDFSHQALLDEATFELETGRGNFAHWDRFFTLLERAHELMARVFGATSAEVALTHHTSEAMNIVLWGHDWQADDEIVTTSLEHDAAVIPLGLLRERHGVKLRFAEIGYGERSLEGLKEVLSEKTRLVVLSHIAYSSGALLPLRETIDLAHDAGARVLVDGAQTCGAMPLDVHALGADFYTLSGQKWMLGPEGTGALYVREALLDELRPTFSSYFSAKHHDFRGNVELQPNARRFETGMVHRPSWAALVKSTAWLLEHVGIERAWQRSIQLASTARERLTKLEGLNLITPSAQASPLLSFDLPAFSPGELF
ncbi:MAG: aminotransferase class V-fold PLP-dependent enzyme, partial [Deltaproteobacteria bacterium]|nr:aminotransferase class V-fold PLP-dependent enzyme [Deltaproteobacteria bacterium]